MLFNSTKKPYISVKIMPKEKVHELMDNVLKIMSDSFNTETKNEDI